MEEVLNKLTNIKEGIDKVIGKIDTSMREKDWKESGNVWQKFDERYVSESGVSDYIISGNCTSKDEIEEIKSFVNLNFIPYSTHERRTKETIQEIATNILGEIQERGGLNYEQMGMIVEIIGQYNPKLND